MTALPNGWANACLMDLVNLHDNMRVPLNQTQRSNKKGIYPYYGANGQVDSIDEYKLDGRYILLAEDGGYFDDPQRGVAYEVSGKFWVNNHAHILSTRGGIPQRYLRYALNALDWMQYVGGSTRLKLTQDGMRKIRFSIPPLNEQKRIATKLDNLLARSRGAREELTHIPRLIDRYKQAVLNRFFNEEKFFHYTSGELSDFITEGLVGLVRSKEQQSDKGMPYIRMNHYDLEGNWNDNDLTRVQVSASELQRYELKNGDILFNTRNSFELVGKVAIWPQNKPGYVYNNNLLRLRFEKRVYPAYAAYYLISPYLRAKIQPLKSATTSVCAIYQKGFLKTDFFFPSWDEQKEIVRRIEKAFAAIDAITAQTAAARHQIAHLEAQCLNKAFRGELVPQDPNDEPASVLLERLRHSSPIQKKQRKA